jgi:hypothetical protein
MDEFAIMFLARRRVVTRFLQALIFEKSGDFAHGV